MTRKDFSHHGSAHCQLIFMDIIKMVLRSFGMHCWLPPGPKDKAWKSSEKLSLWEAAKISVRSSVTFGVSHLFMKKSAPQEGPNPPKAHPGYSWIWEVPPNQRWFRLKNFKKKMDHQIQGSSCAGSTGVFHQVFLFLKIRRKPLPQIHWNSKAKALVS